jgi:hypothetical protein
MTRFRVPLLLAVFAALYLLGAWWGMPSALTPALDSIAPLGPLAFVAKYRQADITYIYPAVHQLVQVAAYAVVFVFAKVTGGLGAISSTWPYGFRDPSGMFTNLLLASNFISALMAVGLLRALWRMRPSTGSAQWFAVSLLGLSGVYAYYTRTANMDIPYLFWIVLAWRELWIYFMERAETRRLWLAGLFSALSVGSKDQASGLILGFGLLLLLVDPATEAAGFLPRFRRAALFTAAVFLCYAAVAIAPQPWRWWQHARFVTSDHVAPETLPTLAGYWELLVRCYWRTHHILTHAGLPLAVAGFVLLWRAGQKREVFVLVGPALAYFFFIIFRTRSTEERYLLPIAIPMALAAGVMIGSPLLRRAGPALATVILACQLAFSLAPVTYCQMFDTKAALAAELGTVVPAGTPIAMHGIPTFNYPNRDVYERYPLMLMDGNQIIPPSTHAANLLHPYDPAVRYAFTGRPEPPPGAWRLVKGWTYPRWVVSHVHVPAVYELFLYEKM